MTEPGVIRGKDPEESLRRERPVDDAADRDVRMAQDFIRLSEPLIGNIGDPDKALNEEQQGWFLDDAQYRARLVKESGGPVDTFEGIVISEMFDPYVQHDIIAFKARARSEDAVRALEAYEASVEVRMGYRLYQARLRLVERAQAFWEWLRRTE